MINSFNERLPLVRPAFLRWSTVAFALLLPFVAHSIWDYTEARRLRARIDAIVFQTQPVTVAPNNRSPQAAAGAADAERFYRAAAALAGGFLRGDSGPQMYRMNAAIRGGDIPPDLLRDVRARVAEYGEALTLADRAAALPLEQPAPGSPFIYLTAELIAVSRLCQMRAMERALAGDGDAALASLYTDLRLERVLELSVPYYRPAQLAELMLALARTRPSAAARARLGAALAEIDRDDFLRRDFVRTRALTISHRAITRTPWIARPWLAHRLTSDLDVFAALVSAAEQPEPGRVRAVIAVGDWPEAALGSDQRRSLLEPHVKALVAAAGRIRCARRLVAGEMVNCQP